MIPDSFDYVVANSIPEAVALLQQHSDEAKILAGGQSLIPLLHSRLAAPSLLIDIIRISELEYIREADGALHIGALTREAQVETSSLIHTRYPILGDTSKHVADPVVRNWSTVGGNLAYGDPANDHPATMIALGAQVVAVGPAGERVIAIEDFFTDSPLETTLRSNEILTEIRIPPPAERSGGAYFKLKRKVGAFAIAGVAAYLTLDPKGLVTYAGIGLTNVGPSPIKASNAEQALLAKPLDDAHIHQAADLAAAASQPGSNLLGSAEYKRAMVRTLCVRALRKALARATGREEL